MEIKRGEWETDEDYATRVAFCEEQYKRNTKEKNKIAKLSNQELAQKLKETQYHCGVLGIYEWYMNEAIQRLCAISD